LARQRDHARRDDERRLSLAADIATYLGTLPKGRKRENMRRDLEAWAAFHGRPRQSLTSPEIARQMAEWVEAGRAASTINHRRQALLNLYHALDGRSAANPVREVPRQPERIEEARGIGYDLVARILAELPERGRPDGSGTRPERSKTRARLHVLAYTGLPHAQIGRITRRDVDLEGATVYVRPRRKGAGVAGRTLPLTLQGVEAFRLMVEADAWGPFSARSMAHSFARAVAKARAKWAAERPGEPWPAPPRLRAYDLRHSFGSALYLATGDIHATAELMLHASLDMTRRYTLSAASARATMAASALGATLVPRSAVETGQNAPSSAARATLATPPNARPLRAKTAKNARK